MSNQKTIYACNYDGCTSTFCRLDSLKSHTRIHENERPYVCVYDDCGKSYIKRSHLKRHEDTHEQDFRCPEIGCEVIFSSRATLKKHVDNIHLKKKHKTYKCSYCDEEFNKHNWLTTHEVKHTGVKPYLCPEKDCGKRFTFPNKLRIHLKVHEGYTCKKPDCNQRFFKWTLYRKHLKVAHPAIHKCHYCEKEFNTAYNLKAHSAVHVLDREVFFCPKPNCTRFYTMERNLIYHIKSYHEKRPFHCTEEHCHKEFKTEVELKSHLSWHDPNKRLRKRKKRKPPFATLLSGVISKNTKPPQNKTEITIKVDQESPDAYKEKEQRETTSTADETVCNQECINIEEKNRDEICLTSDEDVVDEGIQALLDMINKRKTHNTDITQTKREFISFETCFAGCTKAI